MTLNPFHPIRGWRPLPTGSIRPRTGRGVTSLACMLCCAALTGCALAPGMKMPATASAPVPNNAASGSTQPVAIDEIDATLIRTLNANVRAADARQAVALFGRPGAYTLGVGDVLQVTVWDHPELAVAQGAPQQTNPRPFDPPQGFVIDDGGNVQVPYAGNVHVSGLTVDGARQAIAGALARYFVAPKVTVRVASFRAKQIHVDGEVRTPGTVPINDVPLSLFEAVGRAGGFTAAADQSRLELVREGVSYPVDVPGMLALNVNPARLVLRDGDLLRVVPREENGVYVMGEVARPGTALPLRTGRLTLSDALSQAGSFNSASADAAQLYVIRGASGDAPRVFHLDARSPVSMVLANQFDLQPKDIVYVDASNLVRVSRVLSLLLPAINAGLTGAVLTK